MAVQDDGVGVGPDSALKGVALVALAVLLFALGDTVGKHLAMLYAVPLIMAARYLVNLGLLVVFLYPRHGAALWQTRRPWLVMVRGLCLAAGSLSMGLALTVMPVGETVAIIYLAPFAVMLLAGRLLGEEVRPMAWAGAALGFAGVLLIARPGSGLDPTGVALSLVSAACATAYHLLTRVLMRTETTIAVVFHTALVGVVVFCIMALWSLDGPLPGALDMGLTVLFGVLATLGHVVFTMAYREAPAALLAPVNYLHIVFAVGLGWLVFGHVPDGWSQVGMTLVVVSGMGVALRAGVRRVGVLRVGAEVRRRG